MQSKFMWRSQELWDIENALNVEIIAAGKFVPDSFFWSPAGKGVAIIAGELRRGARGGIQSVLFESSIFTLSEAHEWLEAREIEREVKGLIQWVTLPDGRRAIVGRSAD